MVKYYNYNAEKYDRRNMERFAESFRDITARILRLNPGTATVADVL